MKRTILCLAVVALLFAVPSAPLRAGEGTSDLRQMLLNLQERKISVDLEEKPLEEVLKFFSQLTGVNLAVSPALRDDRDADDLLVTLRLTEVSVQTALEVIMELKQVAAVYRSGVIFLTTVKDARGKPVLRIYPIGDLTVRIRDFPGPDIQLHPSGSIDDPSTLFSREEEGKEHAFADPDFIMDLITQNAGEDTWEDEGVRYSVNDRYLFIRQYPSVHAEIAGVLALLRAYR